MKLFVPTNEEVQEYGHTIQNKKIHKPEKKEISNFDTHEFHRQISDTVKKWVLSKNTYSWQEIIRNIINAEKESESTLWHLQ